MSTDYDDYDDYDDGYDPVEAAAPPRRSATEAIAAIPQETVDEALIGDLSASAGPLDGIEQMDDLLADDLLDDLIPDADAPTQIEIAGAAAHAAQQNAAPPTLDLSQIPTSRYSYITGSAGTGKTTLVRAWCAQNPGARLCATTGIAAVNLGDAVTINSLLGYFDTTSLRDSFVHGYLQGRLRRNRRGGITRYILDEVSMLEAPALDLLIDAFEEVNNEAGVLAGHEPEIGLTLVGDFLQLPPIGERPEQGRRQEPAKFAFESRAWETHFAPNILRLTKIHRQADAQFLAGLAALRRGTDLEALEVFRPCFARSLDQAFDGTTVFAKNQEVDRFNQLRLRQLQTPPRVFTSRRTGKQLGEWKHIPETLVLKPGALVMCLCNFYRDADDDGRERQIVAANGDLAEFIGVDEKLPEIARVRIRRTGEEIPIPQILRENAKVIGRDRAGMPIKEILGTIKYTPLRLAYCTTVHKSQGLTLDRVQLSISDPFWASPAMLYVGVSRARSLEGLRIVGNMEQLRARAVFDARVEDWR